MEAPLPTRLEREREREREFPCISRPSQSEHHQSFDISLNVRQSPEKEMFISFYQEADTYYTSHSTRYPGCTIPNLVTDNLFVACMWGWSQTYTVY